MNNVLLEYERKVSEINIYFDFLKLLDSVKPEIATRSHLRMRHEPIDPELIKILKANGFLILYNLAESSMKTALDEVAKQIIAAKTTYTRVRAEIQRQVVEHKLKELKQAGAQGIVEFINSLDTAEIEIGTTNLSGSVDQVKIRKLASSYGFSPNVHKRLEAGSKLHLVKTKRNHLAHGDISFCDCGKDYTIPEMLEIKKQVVAYLKRVLLNISRYLDKRSYRRPRSGAPKKAVPRIS